MYSYGSSARGATGKRGHGGRPYRAPPDRSQQPDKPPPLKACDCLVEIDVPEYMHEPSSLAEATPTTAPVADQTSSTPPPRLHAAFGGRAAVDVMIPGRRQPGRPVAIVAESVWEALPACHYLMQQLVVSGPNHTTIPNENGGQSSSTFTQPSTLSVRIHRSVKQRLPVLAGRLHKVTSAFGCLLDTDKLAVVVLTQLASLQTHWQTSLDNLAFRDASCQFQTRMVEDHDYAFAMGTRDHVARLLREMAASAVVPSATGG